MDDNHLTDQQIKDLAFAVLRTHNKDKLWRALTHDSGPYDVTTPNLALRDLATAFYVAGMAAGMRLSDEKMESERAFSRQVMAQRDSLAAALDERMSGEWADRVMSRSTFIHGAEPGPTPEGAGMQMTQGLASELGRLARAQRQSRIQAGAYPDGNPNVAAQTAQPKCECDSVGPDYCPRHAA